MIVRIGMDEFVLNRDTKRAAREPAPLGTE